VTPEEQYVAALMLAELSEHAEQRDAYTDISVEFALRCDWSFEQRLALRDAAGTALAMLHPEASIEDVVRLAVADACGLSVL
jgi:hypothetical protein